MAIFEVIFNITYLAIIWFVVIKMIKKQPQNNASKYYLLAFLLLAFGDTFHVGFRSIAWIFHKRARDLSQRCIFASYSWLRRFD